MRTAREIFIRAAEEGNSVYDLANHLEEDERQERSMDASCSFFKEDWNEAFAERDDKIKQLEGCISELIEMKFGTAYMEDCDCFSCKLINSAKQLINQKNNEQNTANS